MFDMTDKYMYELDYSVETEDSHEFYKLDNIFGTACNVVFLEEDVDCNNYSHLENLVYEFEEALDELWENNIFVEYEHIVLYFLGQLYNNGGSGSWIQRFVLSEFGYMPTSEQLMEIQKQLEEEGYPLCDCEEVNSYYKEVVNYWIEYLEKNEKGCVKD